MSIVARFTNEYFDEPVEILDTWETGGVKMASVKALEGRPFVGGDKFPTWTAYKTVKAAELSDIRQNTRPTPTGKNLLDLALKQAREQWHNGETVWLWKGKKSGAYLKNDGQGMVKLYLTDRQPGCVIFYLDRNGWELNNKVHTDYRRWLEAVQK
jgi:hypothetical protein